MPSWQRSSAGSADTTSPWRGPQALRVTMPINVRRDDDDPGGNRFTPARFTVPLAIDDPAASAWRRSARSRANGDTSQQSG